MDQDLSQNHSFHHTQISVNKPEVNVLQLVLGDSISQPTQWSIPI